MTEATTTVWRRLWYTRFRDVLRGRFNASLDWRQTIDSADLPSELADAVRQVVGRSRLWRGEKADVAAELVAHFQDGLDGGRSPAELLQSFGNGQAAAQLIRRAKKRNRPMIWQVWRYGWMTSALLLLTYVAMAFWMLAARPTVKIDYLTDFNKPAVAVPEDQRAWPLYRDALLSMGAAPTKEHTDLPILDVIKTKPGEADWKKLDAFLTKHAPALAKLREATARPKLGFVASTSNADFSAKDRELFGVTVPKEEFELSKLRTLEDRWLIATLLPELQQLRHSGQLLAADARRAAAAGDGEAAIANIRAMFGVSKHSEELPFLICLLVADETQKLARGTIQDILKANPKLWSDDQLRNLAHQLVASQIDWCRGFQGERTCFYDSMQRVYTDDGNGDGRLALQVSKDQNLFQLIELVTSDGDANASMFSHAGVAFLTLPAANMAIAGRKEMTAEYDRITDRALARLGEPYWTWKSEPSLDAEVKAITDGPISRFRYFFVMLMTPSSDTFLNRVVSSDGNRDGVFVGLALELYHREHGKWPTSLADLSPKYLPSLPADPITGKPLHYKIVDDRPIVYSVGVDGDDDGGRLAKNKSGETRPEYAEPNHFGKDHVAIGANETDGDWVIWSMAKEN